jgi:hypothetical protein
MAYQGYGRGLDFEMLEVHDDHRDGGMRLPT